MRTVKGTFCLMGLGVALALAPMVSSPAMAVIKDYDISQAQLCTREFSHNERLYGIPTHLLAAISATESGRWNKTLGMVIPWPWTINAEGKGHYFNTKEDAIKKVREYQRQGVKSIDIGCMQVNLKHHPTAFSSLEQAFDPKYNVAYASKFLRNNYEDARSWTKAASYYHSRTPVYGNKYLGRIEKSWSNIVAKVREARAKTGLSKGEYAQRIRASDEEQQFASMEREFSKIKPLLARGSELDIHANAPAATTEQPAAGSRLSAKKARPRVSMKIIQVSDAPRERPSAMVIRPTRTATGGSTLQADNGEALQTVAAASDNIFITYEQTASSRVTTQPAAAKQKSVKPKYIFVE